MSLLSLAFPLVGALIGWIFIRIILGVIFDNLLPIFKPKIAKSLGMTVQTQLSADALSNKLSEAKVIDNLKPTIEKSLDNLLRVRIEEKIPMINALLGDKTINKIKDAVMEELEASAPNMLQKLVEQLGEKYPPAKLVEQHIMSMDERAVVASIKQSLRPQLKLANLAGVLLGFTIGVAMVLTLLGIILLN